jgi:hypothetical protein
MHPLSRQPDHQRQTPIHRARVANPTLRRKAKEELLFLNKKKQKNFFTLGLGRWSRQRPRSRLKEVFWFFFSKKNRLLAFTAPARRS